jgi:hypothetical protein
VRPDDEISIGGVMPKPKMIAWIVALSLVSTLALEGYRTRHGGGRVAKRVV